MRGVSSIVAVVLILLIVIALAGLSYIFFTNVFQTVTEESGAEQFLDIASAGLAIESNSNYDVFARNTGVKELTDFQVYINNEIAEFSGPTKMSPGEISKFTILTNLADGTHRIKGKKSPRVC